MTNAIQRLSYEMSGSDLKTVEEYLRHRLAESLKSSSGSTPQQVEAEALLAQAKLANVDLVEALLGPEVSLNEYAATTTLRYILEIFKERKILEILKERKTQGKTIKGEEARDREILEILKERNTVKGREALRREILKILKEGKTQGQTEKGTK